MTTVREWVDKFLDSKRAQGSKDLTIEWYNGKFKILNQLCGDMDINDVTTETMEAIFNGLRISEIRYEGQARARKGAYQNETLRGFHTAMSALWKFITRRNKWPEHANPMYGFKKPKKVAVPLKFAEFDDVKRLIAHVIDEIIATADSSDPVVYRHHQSLWRDLAMMMVLADTGCRAGGLRGMTKSTLDLENRQAVVYEKYSSSRPVFMNQPTIDVIKQWLKFCPPNAECIFCSLAPNHFGKRLTNSGLIKIIKGHATNAHITGRINPHAWRHMYARLFLLDGGLIAVLSKSFGHSSIAVTNDSYAIFTPSELQDAHDKHSPVNHLGELGI